MSRPRAASRQAAQALGALAIALSALLAALLPAQAARATTEAEIKVGYLANFAGFTEWPDRTEPLTLCLLGADDFMVPARRLDGLRVNNHLLQLRRLATPAALDGCQIVFIGRSARASLGNVLDALDGRPVLTIGDSDGLARMGVMINMVLTADRVTFDINRGATQRSGLVLSARLLQLAREVR